MINIPYKPFWQENLEQTNKIDPRIQSWKELPHIQAGWKQSTISGRQCEVREFNGEDVWHILEERYFEDNLLPFLKELRDTVDRNIRGRCYFLVGKHKQTTMILKHSFSDDLKLKSFYEFAELIITKQGPEALFISLIEVRHDADKEFFDWYLRERKRHFTLKESEIQ